MYNLQKIAPATYLVPKEKGMRVPGLVIATEELLNDVEMEKPLEQVRNVAHLPGIVGHSIAMPDIHWGYGFPIGGVAAMDLEEGVISPGGVGYDINCGVRLALVPEQFSHLSSKIKDALIRKIFSTIPSGVGHGNKGQRGLSDKDYAEMVAEGAKWSIDRGFGFAADLSHMENYGCMEGGDIRAVSEMAKKRGANQVGTVGSGNHFIEMGFVEEIFDKQTASLWNLTEGQIYILIHTGSRGFGHQICQDTLDSFIAKGFAEGLPDKQLVAAPIRSDEGKRYLKAMAAAANFAFNNRQQILHHIRAAFQEICGIAPEKIPLLYDVCHNIAKVETHVYEGKEMQLCVHRKGATRALGPGSKELAADFQKTGQPVLIPGDMGRASFLLAGKGNPLTWSSACHGAGRARSRVQSSKAWVGRDPFAYMQKQGIEVLASSAKTIIEEMPDAYKDVESVVEAAEMGNLAGKVARLKPKMVVKG